MTGTYNFDRRPPCWPVGTPCPNSCAHDLHRRMVTNHAELTGPWAGWRLAGRDLIAPSGELIPERRLRGSLWHANAGDIRDSVRRRNANRKAVQQSMGKVVVVDLGEWRDRHFGRGVIRRGYAPTPPAYNASSQDRGRHGTQISASRLIRPMVADCAWRLHRTTSA